MPNAVTLYGPDNLPLSPAPSAEAFYGASQTSGDFDSWNPFAGSPDVDLLWDRGRLASRSRDLIRNHGLASGAMQTFVDNILGSTGLVCQPKPDYVALGRDFQWAREWARTTKAKFRTWAEASTFEADAAGQADLHGLAVQALRGVIPNGEALAVARYLPRKRGRRYRTALQLVEADRLCNPNNAMDRPRMRGGVEIDDAGAPIAYHLKRAHPGDLHLAAPQDLKWDRVEAKTPWGRRQVLHVFEPERAGVHRGKPGFAAIVGDFHTLGQYQRAELQGALTNAMVAAILQSPMDGATIQEMFGDGNAYVDARDKQPAIKLRRNAVVRLFPGEELKSFKSDRPNDSFQPFTQSLMRIMAAGLNLPYELLLKDFSQSNYSSARAALLEAWRHFLGRREFLAKYFYRPAYALWLEEAVNLGEVEAPDYYDNVAAYTRGTWTGPGRGAVDPLKEAKATGEDLANGVTTLEREAAARGSDWEEDAEQRARERDRYEALGLAMPGAGAARLDGPEDAPTMEELEDAR